MECKHAFTDREIDYILCDKEPKPNKKDRTAVYHAMCIHQAHCPKANCHKLTASWVKCVKLAEDNQKSFEEALGEDVSEPAEEPKTPQKRRRAAQSED